MKIMLGVIAALTLLAGILWWRLDVVSAREQDAVQNARIATQQLEEQKTQADLLGRRFDALDASLRSLGERTAENNQKLGQTLNAIDSIQRTENDSDASISCLDTRVPGQLDHSLQ